jgi:hypothetical protein
MQMKRGSWLLLLVLPLASLLNLQCGYHLAGRGRNLPAAARTIAIPAFANDTPNFAAQQFITAALREEFPRRSRRRLCDALEKADLLLEGRISAFETVSCASRRVEVRISVHVRLIDLKKNELVYEGNGLSFREAYEVPVGDDFFFLATDARDKIAAKFAAGIVSTILDNF